MKTLCVTVGLSVLALLIPGLVYADFYLELAAEDGGETMATATGTTIYGYEVEEDVNLGGGAKLALGVYYMLGEHQDRSVYITVGEMSDSIDAVNGSAEVETTTFDIMYNWHFDAHRLGIGGTHHSSPVYKERFDGFPALRLEFEDAAGLVIEYRYAFSPVLNLGLRYTFIDYEVNGFDLEASGIGGFIGLTY